MLLSTGGERGTAPAEEHAADQARAHEDRRPVTTTCCSILHTHHDHTGMHSGLKLQDTPPCGDGAPQRQEGTHAPVE